MKNYTILLADSDRESLKQLAHRLGLPSESAAFRWLLRQASKLEMLAVQPAPE